MHERRKEPRVAVPVPLQVLDEARKRPLGSLANISQGGLMLFAPERIDPGRIFQVAVTLPAGLRTDSVETLSLGIESLWQEPSGGDSGFWVGFQIIDREPEAAALLARLIDALNRT